MKVWDPGHSFVSGFNMLFNGSACWACLVFCTGFVIPLLRMVESHINKLNFEFLLPSSPSCVRLLSYLDT